MKRYSFPRSLVSARAALYACLSLIALVADAERAGRTAGVRSTDTQALTSALTPPAPGPIDPQKCQDQQDMTWDDYHPIPGANWADPSLVPSRQLRIALVAVDFPDQPFVITLPRGSDPFGNPQIDPIPRAEVPQFYADFYNKPQALNHGHTVNEYWMEQSRGRIGIPKMDSFGPYRMPKNLFQYGLNEWKQQKGCPGGFKCNGRLEEDADALWIADAGKNIRSKYDIILRIYAGYDETSVWQEFGEMKFQTRDDIPEEWGNPDKTKPRWVITRYAPWTSWRVGQMQWGQSTIRQGESSGTITHEIVHFAFRTGDNNNNPYAKPYRRVGCAPWDIVDRGSFNGPGGPHNRWVVPAIQGASMPAGFMLRNRIKFGFVRPENVLKLNRNGLANSGPVVATITARAVDPGPGGLAGITVALDGNAPQDRTPPCEINKDPLCAGAPVFNFYSVEVVQRIGYDSFTPDNGVLIAKNKNGESNSCGYNCFIWVIDAHPEDMNMIDFKRPDGTAVMRTIADYRQLNDALFHAGADSGSRYEWEDTANRLHFYVIDIHRDPNGILSYTVGLRSLDGSGPQERGVLLVPPAAQEMPLRYADCAFTLKNTGAPAATDPLPHPQNADDYLSNDIYRLSVTIDGKGWSAKLRNELVAVKFGDSVIVPIVVARDPASAPAATVTLKAVSESDPTKSSTRACRLTTPNAKQPGP
ncbi:MAG TPA: peptidase M6 [Acidobacteriota bacterium]|nr:peptidase M6 [Acidobacteriota bacterium]